MAEAMGTAPEAEKPAPPASTDPAPAPPQPVTNEAPRAAPQEATAPASGPVDASKPASFENPEAVKSAQKAAQNIHTKLNTRAMTIRQYLEATVVPTLMSGMQALVKERPDDPVEYLAAFLLKNNPNKKTEADPPPQTS